MPQGNSQSIDSVNAKLKFTSNAQAIDSVNADFEILSEGFRLITPAIGEINVTLQPTFSWQDPENRGLYRLVYSLNQDYSNSTKIWTTGTSYTPPSNLTSGTYYWKVEAQTLIDRPPIVPKEDIFTGMIMWDTVTDPPDIYVPSDIYSQSGNTPDGVAPLVLEVANELADYIAQSSGKPRPSVIQIASDATVPQRSIKVGFPNNLTELDEIQIKCSENGPIELTGVDEFDPNNPDYNPNSTPGNETDRDYMSQAGSYHAVMTFIHENIGVVWGWPGEIGEAVPSHSELLVDVVDTTFTPSHRIRNSFYFSEAGNSSPWAVDKQWLKRQRSFYEKYVISIGHGFSDYYDRFHPGGENGGDPSLLQDYGVEDTNFFALEKNGNRNGSTGRYAKMEVGEPQLLQLWADKSVEEGIENNPLLKAHTASFNDSYNLGHTYDARARAMDYPNQGFIQSSTLDTLTVENVQDFEVNEHVGKTVRVHQWNSSGLIDTTPVETRVIASNTANSVTVTQDFSSTYGTSYFYWIEEDDTIPYYDEDDPIVTFPIITDRELLFVKNCADIMIQNHPDHIVQFLAYGPTRYAPKREGLHPNVYVANVMNTISNPNYISSRGFDFQGKFEAWLTAYPDNQIWRGNTGSAYGHRKGGYYTHVHSVGGKIKEYTDMGMVGFKPDALWGHYSTQWPMYYVVTQLGWDHTQDIDVMLDKAYQTLFGNAWTHIKAYYEATESRIESNYSQAITNGGIVRLWGDLIPTLEGHITNAYAAVDASSDEFDRIEYVEAGLTWISDLVTSCQYWVDYNAPAEIIDDTELATGENAVESDVDGVAGWVGDSAFGSGDTIISQSEITNVSDFAFKVDYGNRIASAAQRTIESLQPVVNSTATGGSTSDLIDTGQSFTTDGQVDRSIKIISGTNAGEERNIVSNTGDTIVFDRPMLDPIDNTSVYEINDRFLLSVDVRHTGQGTPYEGGAQFSVRLNGVFMTLNGVNPNEPYGVATYPQHTFWRTFIMNAYGGDELKIGRQADTGGVYIDNFSMKKAKEIDRESIFNAWVDHNANAIEKIYLPKWGDHTPIGERVNPARTTGLPAPSSDDFGGAEPGLE